MTSAEDPAYRSLNLLLVDDDDVDVMTVRRALAKAGLSNPLYVASDGVEALRMLREGSVPAARRLVLLDLNMPRMNGIEFLRELRADEALRHTPVVVLTTSAADGDKVNAYEFNVAGYLIKPVTFSTFVDVMATLDRYWTLVEMP
jgi:CheY-like chemotaxis protein